MRRTGYKTLLVWQQAVDLTESIYRCTQQFPKSEEYVLISQMRRAAISIPSNIAEGSGRGTSRDQISFFRVSVGSLRELETQLIIASRLGYIPDDSSVSIQKEIESIETLLYRLIASLE